ncbi:hypothetical protein AMATHDRAFT_135819, partial [Amanita thiersii Skay4041]
ALSDKALGSAMLLVASVIFVYYTVWAILLPFIDSSSIVHSYFPQREWAVRIPAFLLVIGLSAIGAFIGTTIIKENKKRAQRARLRAA